MQAERREPLTASSMINWSPGWNILRSSATSAVRRRESSCGTHAPAASPDSVVYWAEPQVKTVGWPELERWCLVFHVLTAARSHVLYGQQRCRQMSLPDQWLVMETGIFCRRYLNINNSTADEYFLTKFCGSFADIFIMQCKRFCKNALRFGIFI